MVHFHIVSKCPTFYLLGLFAVLPTMVGSARAAEDPLLTTPPPQPLRIPAEFEPMQAVVVSWKMVHGKDLYKYLAEDVKLILFWDTPARYQKMQSDLTQWGVNMNNCVFYQDSSGYGMVPRDDMPWFLFTDQSVAAFVFNLALDKWRVPAYGLQQGYAVYRSSLSAQGGNFMTDGQGTAVSADPSSDFHMQWCSDAFLGQVWDYWGIHTYHWVSYPHTIGHIDCLAKFLSPDTILVARPPETQSRRKASDEAVAYFGRQVSCYGTPYHVTCVDLDPDAEEPYINSLIVNRRVFVPILNHAATDAAALASYRAAMPGYEVIGIPNVIVKNISGWTSWSALHCDTMGIADEQMLYLQHVPLLDRPPDAHGFPITAQIVAHSGKEFVEDTPVVLWRASTQADQAESWGTWNTTALSPAPALGKDRYLAYIPCQTVGTAMQYYLQAKDASGRNEKHPYIGEPQAHTFRVTALGANVSAVSAQRGGTIEIYMNAGAANAGQMYRLTYSVAADSQTTDTLPDTTVCTGFTGTLDSSGIGAARMTIAGPLTSTWVGAVMSFSLELGSEPNVTPDTVRVQILD